MATKEWIRGEIDRGVKITPTDALAWVPVVGATIVEGPPDGPPELHLDAVRGALRVGGVDHPVTFRDLHLRRSTAAADPWGSWTVWAQVDDPAPGASARPPPEPVDFEMEGGVAGTLRLAAESLLAVIGAVFVWLGAGPGWVPVWAAVALAPHVVRHQLVPGQQSGWGPVMVGALAAVVCATPFAVGWWPCEVSWAPLVLMAVLLVLSGWSYHEPPWGGVLWTFGLVLWLARPEALCLAGHDPAPEGIPAPLQALKRAAVQLHERWEEVTTADTEAQIVSEALPRMTVHQALRDPGAFYGDCHRRVHLSGDALFGRAGDELRPAAGAHLRPLRRLLALHPEVRIVVEGNVGTGSHRRGMTHAQAVIDWMRDNATFSPGRFVPNGFGAGHELASDPELAALSRRIEVYVECP